MERRSPNPRAFTSAGSVAPAIAGDIAYGMAEDDLAIPFRVVRDYQWPASIGDRALCVLSSYSGNTEETLSLYDEARGSGATCLAITSGGALAERAARDGVPHLSLPPGLPPRAALGYSLISVVGLFRSLGWTGVEEQDLDETERVLEQGNQLLGVDSPESENPAKQLALALRDHAVILYTPTRHLSGIGVRWKGQINENSKRIAFHASLPELNHNEIVGWETMREIHPRFRAVFLRDREDHPRVSRRIALDAGNPLPGEDRER